MKKLFSFASEGVEKRLKHFIHQVHEGGTKGKKEQVAVFAK